MKYLHLLILLLCCQFAVTAQIDDDTIDSLTTDSILIDTIATAKKTKGDLVFFNTAEADSLVQFQKKVNKTKCPNLVQGYRVQIYSCSGTGCPEKAEKNYNQFLIAYPDIAAEKIWEAPSYKVRVGNCRNRFEAEAIKARIKEDFPFIFVVPDYISSPFKVECEEMK